MSQRITPPIRLLVVENKEEFQSIFQKYFQDHEAITLVDFAVNGVDALRKRKDYDPEVVLMNASMPEMDGLTTLPELLKLDPYLRVLMLFSPDKDNSEASAEAMVLGAADVIIKPKFPQDMNDFLEGLVTKIVVLGKSRREHIQPLSYAQQMSDRAKRIEKNLLPKPRVLAIGSSTGGPQALTTIFKQLRGNLPDIPILITQHMPANFTSYLSMHIEQACGRKTKEAEHGEEVRSDTIYVAPGDYHLVVKEKNEKIIIALNQEPPENFCRPAVDPMFRSLAGIFKNKILAIVLTGMGKDGLEGAKVIAEMGGEIVAQDEHSSVVWGMPKAVKEAGICNEVLPIDAIAHHIIVRCG